MIDELATIRLQVAIARSLLDEVERHASKATERVLRAELADELVRLAEDLRDHAARSVDAADTTRPTGESEPYELDRVA